MFEVNKPQLDYLSLTSFNPVALAAMNTWHNSVQEVGRESHRMQYTGDCRSDRYGTSFLGIGEQRGMTHGLMQVSGSLAESAFNALRIHLLPGHCKVTRIDLQVTVEYPREVWSQADLANDLRHESPHRSVSYIESQSGPQQTKLATVYYGSRTSDRMVRIYEKLGMADEVLLRFEVEFKGHRAAAAANTLMQGASKRAILWAEVLRMPDVYNMRRMFGKVLDGDAITIRTVNETGSTEKWLRTVVAPSLDRFLNQHEEDVQPIAVLLHRIIAPHLPEYIDNWGDTH